MSRSITIPTSIKNMNSRAKKSVIGSLGDCVDNLHYIASQRTPYSEGTLEQSGTKSITVSSNKIVGTVSFRAMNKGYNYAIKMDSDKYNLGEKSKKKSSGGVKSKFYKGTLKVGSGYLTDTASKCRKGYIEHIQDGIGISLK